MHNVTETARRPDLESDVLSRRETPRLILDRDIMEANIGRMAARCESLGVALRPHLKTPKSLPVAQSLLEAGAAGFTTSTLTEAEYLLSAGLEDVFYAVPIEGGKVARAARLLRAGHGLSLLTDSVEAVLQVAARAAEEGVVLPLWVEIDVDHYRTGVDFRSPSFSDLIVAISQSPSTRLVGLMSYGGRSYTCDTVADTVQLTETHRVALLQAADVVEAMGSPRPRLSFGSTPAVLHARSLEGIDEVRCGIYVFQDLFQAGIGACRVADIAISVLATVIGHAPQHQRLTIDAGALALSKDRSTQGKAFDAGFGVVCDVKTGQPIGDLQVSSVSQELGLVTSPGGAAIDFARLPIGSKVRVLPNHADMTAAAYEDYLVIGENHAPETWLRVNRWDSLTR